MRWPRLRIGWVMALVAVAALNLAACRACFYTYWTDMASRANQLEVGFVGALPMANALLIGLLVAWCRRRSRPFLIGFEATGLVAWLSFVTVVWLHPHGLVRRYLFTFQGPLIDAVHRGGLPLPVRYAILVVAAAIILGWWQLALAVTGGLVSRARLGGTSRLCDTLQAPIEGGASLPGPRTLGTAKPVRGPGPAVHARGA